MRRPCVLLVALALLIVAPAASARPVTTSSLLSFSGLGGIGIGERISVVRERLGQTLTYSGFPDSSCGGGGELRPRRYGVSYLSTGFRVASVTVTRRGIATPSGIRVGDSLAKVRRAYPGRLVGVRNIYTQRLDLHLRSVNRKIIFFASALGHVAFMSAGRRPEIDYVEGCA